MSKKIALLMVFYLFGIAALATYLNDQRIAQTVGSDASTNVEMAWNYFYNGDIHVREYHPRTFSEKVLIMVRRAVILTAIVMLILYIPSSWTYNKRK